MLVDFVFLSSRTASRVCSRVAKGPSVLVAFGSASVPDHLSEPCGER